MEIFAAAFSRKKAYSPAKRQAMEICPKIHPRKIGANLWTEGQSTLIFVRTFNQFTRRRREHWPWQHSLVSTPLQGSGIRKTAGETFFKLGIKLIGLPLSHHRKELLRQ
jgi:hypothetical protein